MSTTYNSKPYKTPTFIPEYLHYGKEDEFVTECEWVLIDPAIGITQHQIRLSSKELEIVSLQEDANSIVINLKDILFVQQEKTTILRVQTRTRKYFLQPYGAKVDGSRELADFTRKLEVAWHIACDGSMTGTLV